MRQLFLRPRHAVYGVVLAVAAEACAGPAAPPATSSPSPPVTVPPPGSVPPPAATVPSPPPGSAAPFEGTRWVLVRLGDERVVTTTDDPRRVPHLVFADGRATGSGGCNRIAGAYARRGGEALTVGPMAGTRMACPDAMATEAAFVAAMERVRAWRVVDGRLELLDAPGGAGRVVAAFLPAPAPER